MARQKLDKETKKQILEARKMINDVAQADGNEAETRRRVERIFEQVLGYDVFKHMSREHAVKGAGETEYCDWVVNIDEKEDTRPHVFVELKRVNINLAPKHLKQVTSYAINAGCEWIILTNGKEWRVYHVSFGQPPETKLIESWNLLDDDPVNLAANFKIISYRNLKKGGLEKLWRKRNVLTVHNVVKQILSEDALKLFRRQLNKLTDVNVTPEEIVGAVRRVFNEAALTEMNSIRISLPERKARKRSPKTTTAETEKQPEVLAVDSNPDNESEKNPVE